MSKAKSSAPVSEPVLAEQPFLFDAKLLPMRQDLVLMVKEKRFLHTGKITGGDEELCRAVCRDLQLGLSGRKVAKKYRISRNSVLGIETVMRDRGELEPLKKAILCQLDDIIYLGLERIKEGIAEDEISPGQLPIPIAALIDKKGQLESGMVPGTERTVQEVTAEQVEAAFRRMKRVTVTEGKSVGKAQKPQQTGSEAGLDTALDTLEPGPEVAGLAAAPPMAAPEATSLESAAEGGGGSAQARPLETTDGKGNPNFDPKDTL